MSPLRLLWLLLLQHLGFAGAALEYILFTHSARMGSNTTIPCKFDVNAVPPAQRTFSVLWLFQDKEIFRYPNNPGALNSRLSLDQDRIKDGIADLYISGVSISDGGLYKCSMVQIPGEKEKEIRLDVYAPPRITITGKNITKTKENVLSCAISGFYPVDIDIKWLRDGKILNNIILEKPQRDPDGMYSVKSLVTIIPTEEDRNRIFSCRIQHESLTAPLQEDFKLVFRDTKNPILYTIVIPVIAIVILVIIIAVAIFWIKRKGNNDHNKGKNPENEEEKLMPSNQQGNNDHNNGKHSENEEEKVMPSNQQGKNDHNEVKHPENQVETLMPSNQQALSQTSHDFSEGQESHSKSSVNRQDSEHSGLHTVPDDRKSTTDCTASLSDLCSVDPHEILDRTQNGDSGKRQTAQQPKTALSQTSHDFSKGQESHSKPSVNRQDSEHSGLHTVPDNRKSTSDSTASLSDSCSVDPHHILYGTQNGDSGKRQAAQQPKTAVSQTSHDFSEGQESHSKSSVNRQDSGHSGLHTVPDNRKSTTDCTASHSDSSTVDQHDISDRTQNLDTQNGDSGKPQSAQQPKTALSQIGHDFSEGQESHSKPSVNRQDSGHSGLHTVPDNRKSTSDCTASHSNSRTVGQRDILGRTQNGDSGKQQAAQQPKTALSQISHDFSEGQESHSKPPVNQQDSEHSGLHTVPDNRKSTTDCTVSLSDSCSADPQDILNRTQNGDSGKPQSAQQPNTAGNQGGLNQAKNTSSEHQSNPGHQRTSLPKHQATKPFMDGNKEHLNEPKDACHVGRVAKTIQMYEARSSPV